MVWRQTPGWSADQELAAIGVEVAHSSLRVLIGAHARKGASIPKPLRIPRPTDQPRRRRRATRADLAAYGGTVGTLKPRADPQPEAVTD